MNQSILIIGAGPMAVAYAQVLKEMGREFDVIGRGEASADAFAKEVDVRPLTGGIEKNISFIQEKKRNTIVAVSEENLGQATLQLLELGSGDILIEKPGGFLPDEIKKIDQQSRSNQTKVFVGYNRRFFASTQAARNLIQQDGGVSSFHFEFTEWGHVLRDIPKFPGVKEEWFLHNSTHLVDLAFFLGGEPTEMSSFIQGSLDWHPKAQVYAGAGKTTSGALFSYHANWGGPGRFNLEILTNKNRYHFRPIEKLQVQKLGTVSTEEVSIQDELDLKFKPGIYKQTEAFLQSVEEDKKSPDLQTIGEQVQRLTQYQKMES